MNQRILSAIAFASLFAAIACGSAEDLNTESQADQTALSDTDVEVQTLAAKTKPPKPPKDKCPGFKDFGKPCGNCGGTWLCNGTCSSVEPADFGQACGCGGTVQCNGTCSAIAPVTPPDCAACGGVARCDGTCSVVLPADYGQPCSACGGTVQCNGTCNIGCPL